MRTIGAELRKGRESRESEQERDRDARSHELEKERAARLYELRRSTFGGLVENSIRQGVTHFAVRLDVPVADRGAFVEQFVRLLRPLMDAHLVASKETVVAVMAANRATLQQSPLEAYSRPMLAALRHFALWTEHQIPLLLEMRADLGFDRDEIPALKQAWLDHLQWQLNWMREVDAQLAAGQPNPIGASPPTTPQA